MKCSLAPHADCPTAPFLACGLQEVSDCHAACSAKLVCTLPRVLHCACSKRLTVALLWREADLVQSPSVPNEYHFTAPFLKVSSLACSTRLTIALLQCGADLVLTLRAEGPPVVQCSSAPMCRMRTFFPAACQAAAPTDVYCPQCTHGEVLTVDFRCANFVFAALHCRLLTLSSPTLDV